MLFRSLPSVNISGIYTRIGKITEISIPSGPGGQKRTFRFGTPNRMNFEVKLQMPVFTWGWIGNTIALSETGRDLSELDKKQQMAALTDQTLRAFYAVLLNEEVIRLHQANLRRAEDHLQATREQYNAGLVPKLEKLRAAVQVKNIQTSLNEAYGNLEKSRIFLAKTVGKNDEKFLITGELQYVLFTQNVNRVINRALQHRSDLKSFKIQQRMKGKQISIAGSGNKPNLFFFSGYNVQNGFDPMNPDKFIDNWSMGLQLSIPLFDGFATRHKVEQAKIELRSVQMQEKEIEDLIRMQIRQTFVAIRQAEQKIQNQEENIALAKEAYSVAEKQFRQGLVSSLEVSDARQALNQNELVRTQAIFNHIMAKLDLCKAIEDYTWFESSVEK